MKLNIWKKSKNNLLVWLVLAMSVVFYFRTFFLVNRYKPYLSGTQYYNSLLKSFLAGKLDISGIPVNYDLSLYQDKWYMYWGPAPVLLLLPFYLIGGVNTSDVVYTLVYGAANVFLFYWLVEEVISIFSIKIGQFKKILLILSFAIASPNFYMAVSGNIWHSSQIFAVFYTLLGFIFFLKYLRRGSYFNLSLSFLFYCLAWMTRLTLIFYGLIYFYPVYLAIKGKMVLQWKYWFVVLGIGAVFLSVFLGYNYFRFGNSLETGFKYQQGNERYDQFFKAGKMFSLSFVRHNFGVYFLNHLSVSLERPFIRYDVEGNSVVSVYPLLVFLPFLFVKKEKAFKNKRLVYFLIIPVFLITALLMLNVGTGWVQFGCRYILDVLPLLYVLCLLAIVDLPAWLVFLLVLYGLLVNYLGCLYFYGVI